MALQIASLNSGSNGNAYYVGNQTDAVLVDAGLSCKELESRMQAIGLSMHKVKALFISHEHTDHVKGVNVLAKKYALPVYISKGTYDNSRLRLHASQLQWLKEDATTNISGLNIKAFSKKHDAREPYSFTIEYNNITVGVFTDIGIACENLIHHFKQCHAAFLESNYDEAMLESGRYPWVLKQRIRGGYGHLSNKQALDVFINHRPEFMSHLLLSHLSKDNNCPKLVQQLFEQHAQQTKIVVASRYEASPLFHVSNNFLHNAISPKPILPKPMQMNLFG
ncbi:MAG: MBL fold metallo-hydrolase [Chitinophagaceae bacterium]|nr:MAG: MBL fold metallo-hydrolase [Chitinophagaceae bacterium]